jgi:hypothetical protein
LRCITSVKEEIVVSREENARLAPRCFIACELLAFLCDYWLLPKRFLIPDTHSASCSVRELLRTAYCVKLVQITVRLLSRCCPLSPQTLVGQRHNSFKSLSLCPPTYQTSKFFISPIFHNYPIKIRVLHFS